MKCSDSRRVLVAAVVEDMAEIRQAVKAAIEEAAASEDLECSVSMFREPADVLSAVEALRPDVVVMDFQKSGSGPNGWDAALRIRETTGAEILIYTANSGAARRRAELSPIEHATIIPKPATHAEVCRSVRTAVRRHAGIPSAPRPCGMAERMGRARLAAASDSEDEFLSQVRSHGRRIV